MNYLLFTLFLTVVFGLIMYRREITTTKIVKNWSGSEREEENVRKGNLKLTVLCCVVFFIVFGIINFFGLPVLSLWGFHAVWVEISIAVLLGAVLSYAEDFGELYLIEELGSGRFIPTGIIIVIFIISNFQTCSMGRSDEYQKMLTVEIAADSLFNTEVHPISVEKMRTVDQTYARKIAEDKLGLDPGLRSRVEVGKMTIQSITAEFTIDGGKKLSFENDLIWVAPLEHTSWVKWANNDVTPGYVIVDATDYQKVYLVKQVNGKELKLRYIESGCFGDDIERHIKNNGFASQGITDHCFEIDNLGNPYWVLANYEKTIGFSGEDSKGVIVVDAQTGDLNQYTIDKAPEWIDRIQPEEMILDQIQSWGEYKKGWINSFWQQDGVENPTSSMNGDGSSEMSLVYSQGRSYWYTGIKSSKSDESTSGFILVDTKTKNARLYRISGVNESEAKRIAEDQPVAKSSSYKATQPILYNVRGIPTYFVTLKGGSGNVTGFCFIAVNNRQVVGYGDTKTEAQNNYLNKLRGMNNDQIKDGPVKTQEKQFVVRGITLEGENYYILFEGVKEKEFFGSSKYFRELRWTKKGDKVSVSYGEGQSNLVPLDSFDNLNFEF